jgi:hypothetical protein
MADVPTGDPTPDEPQGGADPVEVESWWSEAPGRPSATAPPDGSGEGAGSPPKPGDRRRLLLAAGAIVVVLAAGVGVAAGRMGGDSDDSTAAASADGGDDGGGAQAGPGPQAGGRQPGVSGTITAVDGSTFTVSTSEDGTVEVSTTDETTFSETLEGSSDDLAVGDHVSVVGGSEGDGSTVTAGQVIDAGDNEDLLGGGGAFGGGGGGGQFGGGGDPPEGFDPNNPPEDFEPPEGVDPNNPPEDFEPPEGVDPDDLPQGAPGGGGPGAGGFTTGTIASTDGDSFTVTTDDGETVTVTLSSDSTVLLVRELSVDDLAVDDEVTVVGEAADDAVTATSVRRGDAGFGFGGGFGPPPNDSGASSDASA